MIYHITPVPAPRMTKADAWKKRPCVLRYFAFKDEVKLKKIVIPTINSHVTFVIKMPESWSKKKRLRMAGEPHTSKPDVDNLLKALLDAVFSNDSHISDIRVTKIWGDFGRIRIEA